jgi:hypothetical protein
MTSSGDRTLGKADLARYNPTVSSTDSLTVGERMRVAFDLYDVGEQLLRQRFRREHPEMSPEAIEARVQEWRLRRPGAELGDGEGVPVEWPRKR